jgi:geranylgeranyl pyrophosphate synthase
VSVAAEMAFLQSAEVREYRERLEELLRATAGASDGPAGAAALHTVTAGGKRLRPLLVFLSTPERARGSLDVVRAGAAVELIHSASLVHDDVLDRAPVRRGRPTVWATAGEAVATATGDHLFALAFRLLVATGDMGAVDELASCTLGLARGEAMQMLQARRADTTPAAYLERCGLKTGLLFATACSLGGRLGGLDEERCAALAAYGHALGLAFQIADDVLDCAGSMESTGKPLGTDLLDGTTTYPLLLAAAVDPFVARAVTDGPEPGAVLEILARVAETGAIGRSRERANEEVRRAVAALDHLDDHLDTLPLRAVARGVVDRET